MSDRDNDLPTPAFQNLLARAEYGRENSAEQRRRLERGRAVNAETRNIALEYENDKMSEEIRQLKEKNEKLEEKLGAVSILARTRYVDSEALRKTIVHLEQAWGTAHPTSPSLEEVSSNLDAMHRKKYVEVWNDPSTITKFNQEIKEYEDREREKKRYSPKR